MGYFQQRRFLNWHVQQSTHMASSANSSDHDTETEEGEIDASRFVVSAEQLREGDFETLDDVRKAIDADSE